jgi:hypothetical protein
MGYSFIELGTEAHVGRRRAIDAPTKPPSDTTTDTKGLERVSAEVKILQQATH